MGTAGRGTGELDVGFCCAEMWERREESGRLVCVPSVQPQVLQRKKVSSKCG